MFEILTRYFKKRGITSVEELSEEERITYDKWVKILSEKELTMDGLLDFCRDQKRIVEGQITNMDNSDKKDNILKAALSFYNTMIGIIEKPKAERESLIRYLEDLLK